MMRKLNDLPLWGKMVVAPAVMLAAMLTMAWMTFGEFGQQRTALERLDTVVFERLRHAMAVTDAVTSFHAGLYHLMSVASNESDQKHRTDLAKALASQMTAVESLLKELDASLDPGARARFAAIDGSFANYKTGALQVVEETSTSGAAYGAMMMGDTDSTFQTVRGLLKEFDVRGGTPTTRASALSGGNQQKVVVAREVSRDPAVLIAAQPTRGLDVGAIEFVHRRLVEQRDAGKAVLLVSLELDEVLGLADRIVVIYEGRIVGEFDPGVTEEELGIAMTGGRAEAAAV